MIISELQIYKLYKIFLLDRWQNSLHLHFEAICIINSDPNIKTGTLRPKHKKPVLCCWYLWDLEMHDLGFKNYHSFLRIIFVEPKYSSDSSSLCLIYSFLQERPRRRFSFVSIKPICKQDRLIMVLRDF